MSGKILGKVMASPRLPSLPAIAVQVLELTRDNDVQLNQIADVIQNDQALSAKILRTINSSFYGLSKPCSSIKQAMAYLGLNAVKSLVLGFSLAESINGGGDEDVTFDYLSYWRRTVLSAAAAREIAETVKACDPEDAFLGALMQDLAMVALYRTLGDQYLQVIDMARVSHNDLPQVELSALNTDHTIIGEQIVLAWNLPPQLVQVIRHHHSPDEAGKQWRQLTRTVTLGGHAAESLCRGEEEANLTELYRLGKQWFDLSQKTMMSLLERVGDNASEVSKLFDVDTGRLPDTESILQHAEEQRMQHEYELSRQKNDLQIQRFTDDVTGCPNRKMFTDALRPLFSGQQMGDDCSLLLVSTDNFKSINEKYDCETADQVLAGIAKRTQQFVGGRGTVFRFVGVQLAVLLPGMGRSDAAKLAEALRGEIEAEPLSAELPDGETGRIALTASIGVTTLDGQSRGSFAQPRVFVSAANKAALAAESSGGNCVRVYMPRAAKQSEPSEAA